MRKISKRVVTGFAATVAATAMTSALGATPAFAGTNTSLATVGTPSYPSGAGLAYFYHAGEHLRIVDNAADGAGVRIYWAFSDPRGNVYENGTAYVGGAYEEKNINMSVTDGHTISFTLCVSDNGSRIQSTCSQNWATA
ncbi:hypothetical protein KZ829_16655 [Actinoplanes hulinensis]|uniref:PKD domain-containing protein n=1 Tax=Actinoplanes hulinensis TaxID=1144547 RepID=A0ABS7B2W1_9ACTN|nr:hypothetical protein [Actinoplanes hulinensis]MBW6435370.1 hypothetical protein [Actinoplanes hulinensis]